MFANATGLPGGRPVTPTLALPHGNDTTEESDMNMQSPNFIAVEKWTGKALFSDWQTTGAGAIEVRDPATDALLASVGLGGPADIARAAAEAKQAQRAWAKTLPTERAAILNKAADLLVANGEELIGWIMRESGSIRPKASIEIEHGARVKRVAIGADDQLMVIDRCQVAIVVESSEAAALDDVPEVQIRLGTDEVVGGDGCGLHDTLRFCWRDRIPGFHQRRRLPSSIERLRLR